MKKTLKLLESLKDRILIGESKLNRAIPNHLAKLTSEDKESANSQMIRETYARPLVYPARRGGMTPNGQ